MSELRSNWGAGWIAGLGPKFIEAENLADLAYALGIDSALGVEENNFTRLFKERQGTGARETQSNKSGIAYFKKTSESEDYKQDDRQPGYETQWNWIKETQGITISEENRADRDFNVQDKMDEARDLKIAYLQTVDRDAFSIFNNAFTAPGSLPDILTFYNDGVALCSGSHPIKNSTTSNSTQSNVSATSIALSEVNLEVGRLALSNQTDDRDMLMSIGSNQVILLVPRALEKLAVTIAKSTKRSNTANNDLNIYDGIVTVISTKLISAQATAIEGVGSGGSDTAWFLIDAMKSPLIFGNKQGYKPSTWIKESNKDLVHDASTRYQVGNKDFRGFWGSAGA